MNNMRAIHPGEIIREEYLKPLGMSAHALATALRVSAPRINDVVREKRGGHPARSSAFAGCVVGGRPALYSAFSSKSAGGYSMPKLKRQLSSLPQKTSNIKWGQMLHPI